MQANLNTQAAREKATCFRHLLKQLKERLSSYGCPTVRTMQGKPMLQWHQWQLAWLSELKNQGHIDNTLTVVTLVRGATVSAVNSRQVRKLLDNNTIMIITKLGRAWVNPTLVKVVYIFSYYLLHGTSLNKVCEQYTKYHRLRYTITLCSSMHKSRLFFLTDAFPYCCVLENITANGEHFITDK